MPEISLFYGIRVTMYYDDHNPPHFYAEYNGNKAIIEIDAELGIIKGWKTDEPNQSVSLKVR
jgi:hypothetical protein